MEPMEEFQPTEQPMEEFQPTEDFQPQRQSQPHMEPMEEFQPHMEAMEEIHTEPMEDFQPPLCFEHCRDSADLIFVDFSEYSHTSIVWYGHIVCTWTNSLSA